MSRRVKMRLSGLPSDINAFMILFKKMDQRKMISLLEESADYPNRGESKLVRKYLEIEMLLPIEENQS